MNRLINFNSIDNQKFILTILIVYAHTYGSMNFPASDVVYNFVTTQIIRLAGGAVGTFFAISTILFFNKFTIETYERKLLSRFKSLVIPYFILSISTLLLSVITQFLKGNSLDYNIQTIINAILYGKHDGPIWFLRTLFFFVLIAPALYYVVKRISLRLVLLIYTTMVVINSIISPTYTSLLYWLPIIVLFSYIGINGIPFKIKSYIGYVIAVLLLIILHITGWGGENAIPVYIFRMISPIAIILILNSLTYKSPKFYSYSMFVYLTHIIILRLVTPVNNPLLHIPKTIIVFVICTFIAIILNKVSPKIYSLISGGR